MALAGFDPILYAGHSFRIGATITTAQHGLPDSLIKTLGHWQSSAYTVYIRTPRDTLCAVASLLACSSAEQGIVTGVSYGKCVAAQEDVVCLIIKVWSGPVDCMSYVLGLCISILWHAMYNSGVLNEHTKHAVGNKCMYLVAHWQTVSLLSCHQSSGGPSIQ